MKSIHISFYMIFTLIWSLWRLGVIQRSWKECRQNWPASSAPFLFLISLVSLIVFIVSQGTMLDSKARLADAYKRKSELLEEKNARMLKGLEDFRNEQKRQYDSLEVEAEADYSVIRKIKTQ